MKRDTQQKIKPILRTKRVLPVNEPSSVKDLEEKFRVFLEQCPPRRFSRNLRTMLLEFMMTSGTEAPYVKDLLLDLESLFELLDVIEDDLLSPQRRRDAKAR